MARGNTSQLERPLQPDSSGSKRHAMLNGVRTFESNGHIAVVTMPPLSAVLFVMLVATLSSCHGFFVDPILTAIAVTPTTPSIALASTQQMLATGTYDDGSTKTLTDSIDWSSSDSTTASVTSTGIVAGVSAGTASITATSGTISGSTTVTITVTNLESLTISPTSAAIRSGQAQAFTAIGTLMDGGTVDLTDSVTWSSSNTSAATISAGVATAETVTSVATTNITATSGTVTSNTAVLTVNP